MERHIMLESGRLQAEHKGPGLLRIPEIMPAEAIDHFGGPEVLTLRDLPVPKPDAGEVLIALRTAGVGPWDIKIRRGLYLERKPRFPLVLGTDGAGIVVAAGSQVRRLKVGDKVYSYSWDNPKGGFYAKYVTVAAEKVAHIPKHLDSSMPARSPRPG
jgi:NADPH:quinone reductase-like Zn-dependent oxidoreductase